MQRIHTSLLPFHSKQLRRQLHVITTIFFTSRLLNIWLWPPYLPLPELEYRCRARESEDPESSVVPSTPFRALRTFSMTTVAAFPS
jgi:hypothetical protein